MKHGLLDNVQTQHKTNVHTWYKAKPPTTVVLWELKVQSNYQINTKPQLINISACKGHAQMDKHLGGHAWHTLDKLQPKYQIKIINSLSAQSEIVG
jgi:hypothetical protein